MADIPIHVIWLEQDDPKKNTAVKLAKKGLITMHKKVERLPRRGIILDPLCGKVFGPEDHELLESGGAVVGLDCSWAQIESSVDKVTKNTKLQRRMLPLVLAANPVNWGKPSKLTTAEAIATILFLRGNEMQAKQLLSKFNWGQQFFILNAEPLKAYSAAKTSSELIDLQFEFFDIEHLRE